jgi:rhodanese-related sulfurtransferase
MPDDSKITVDEARKQMQAGKQLVFLDTRNPHAWAQSDVILPGAIRVPVDEFEKHLPEIPKDKPLVTYCT